MKNNNEFTTIELTQELRERITFWKISRPGEHGSLWDYSAKSNTVEGAMKKARNRFPDGILQLSGCTMHAETKPLLFDFPQPK